MPQSTNYAKFQTRNPVVRRLIGRFYDELRSIVDPLQPESVLDAGCGEGETIARLSGSLPSRITAVDTSAEALDFTARRFPSVEVHAADVRCLPFDDAAFDLVMCLEVLEHIDDPIAAVEELTRVCRADMVISVPREPWFRAGSLLRGRYVRDLGNHPEHVNHWTAGSLRAFLEPRVEVVSLTGAFPWLLARCRPAR